MRMASLFVCVALSMSALAAHHHVVRSETAMSAVTQPADPQIVEKLFAGAVHAQTVGDNRSSRYFIIPAAGSLAGANGTFFRSDVTLINYASTPEDVIALFWPAGQSTPPSVSGGVRLTLQASKAITYTDFVATVLNKSGLGAILFFGVKGSSIDANAAIDGLSRIYTKQPGAEGTVSQEFPPV